MRRWAVVLAFVLWNAQETLQGKNGPKAAALDANAVSYMSKLKRDDLYIACEDAFYIPPDPSNVVIRRNDMPQAQDIDCRRACMRMNNAQSFVTNASAFISLRATDCVFPIVKQRYIEAYRFSNYSSQSATQQDQVFKTMESYGIMVTGAEYAASGIKNPRNIMSILYGFPEECAGTTSDPIDFNMTLVAAINPMNISSLNDNTWLHAAWYGEFYTADLKSFSVPNVAIADVSYYIRKWAIQGMRGLVALMGLSRCHDAFYSKVTELGTLDPGDQIELIAEEAMALISGVDPDCLTDAASATCDGCIQTYTRSNRQCHWCQQTISPDAQSAFEAFKWLQMSRADSSGARCGLSPGMCLAMDGISDSCFVPPTSAP